MIVHLLLEGFLEEPLARSLLRHTGHDVGSVFGKRGCAYIKKKVKGFRHYVSAGTGLLALTDLMDSRCPCPRQAHTEYLACDQENLPAGFILWFMVNELESWLMADRDGLAHFLRVSAAIIPDHPDSLRDPKRRLVAIAQTSTSSKIRKAMVPGRTHGGVVGPDYTATMERFIAERWSPDAAGENSPSLRGCLRRLRALHSLPSG
ncbi:MAG: DUF4276 family protein [Planctomycetes bacterium]|nr:DUF4276 family protein [Planctomycetota bacterium]